MNKNYKPDMAEDARELPKPGLKEHLNEIADELDNQYDSYLKDNQQAEFEFNTNAHKDLQTAEMMKQKMYQDFDSELDDKYTEYIRQGKEFHYKSAE